MLEQLLKGIANLKIAVLRRADEQPSTLDQCCIWCDDAMHDWRRCDDYKEALRQELVHYEGNRIHSTDSRKALRTNYRTRGMKKVLEEETVTKKYYAPTVGIRVGELATKTSFLPEVVETASETSIREIRNKEDEVRELTQWECPVDRTSVEVLCQAHDVFLDEEKQRIQVEVGSSHVPENRNSEEEKVLAFELALDIEQRMDH
jgi:hypothetical protein